MAKKVLLGSDKMTLEEYKKEDFSRMRNLVADYERCRTDGLLLLDYQQRLQEMIDEIIRDPRNVVLIPKFLKGEYSRYSTPEETKFFYEQLKKQVDPIDMRNKLERIMDKPYSEITRSEQEAFYHFVLIKGLPQVDGPESIQPDVFFYVHDKVYRGHKAIKEMDAEREKFGGNVPETFERAYKKKLADIVITAPQIFTELPKTIVDVNKPNNIFFDRLIERASDVRALKEAVEEKRVSGQEITKEDLFKENLFKSLEIYQENTERFAEEELARIEAQLDALLKDEKNIEGSTPVSQQMSLFDDITPEQLDYFSKGEISQEDQSAIDEYYANLTIDDKDAPPAKDETLDLEMIDEDLYFPSADGTVTWENPSIDDVGNFASLEAFYGVGEIDEGDNLDSYQDYIFDPTKYESIDVDDYDNDDVGIFSLGTDKELQNLVNEWYQLNNKERPTSNDLDKMIDLETKMGFKVSQDQSSYMSIPSEIVNPSKGNSPFFNELLENVGDQTLDPIIESDLSEYKVANARWKNYNSPEELAFEKQQEKGVER